MTLRLGQNSEGTRPATEGHLETRQRFDRQPPHLAILIHYGPQESRCGLRFAEYAHGERCAPSNFRTTILQQPLEIGQSSRISDSAEALGELGMQSRLVVEQMLNPQGLIEQAVTHHEEQSARTRGARRRSVRRRLKRAARTHADTGDEQQQAASS